jgi:hypothetical protein
MALTPQSVDVFLSNNDSQPAPHQGVQGRIQALSNAMSTHFQHGTPTMPPRFSLEPRGGFTNLAIACRDTAGTELQPTWDDPSYLGTVGDSLVTVENRHPRVWNGFDYWVDYRDTTTVLTNKLREDTLVGGYGTIQCPDHAVIGNVQAVCFTLNLNQIWLGFREANGSDADPSNASKLTGPWIIPPFNVTGNLTGNSVSHVLTDGTVFFLIYNDDGAGLFRVKAYDTHGVLLDSDSFAKLDGNKVPGYWDTTVDAHNSASLIHAQPLASTAVPATDVHVRFTRIGYSSGITLSGTSDATVICNSRCQWLKNAFDTTNNYLVTTGPGSVNMRLRAYRIGTSLAQTAEWDIDDPSLDVDAIAGYVTSESSAIAIYAVIGFLEPQQDTGPQYDPQLRFIQTYRVDGGGVTLPRRSTSQALVSRSFLVGTDWIETTFYQSGSGLDNTATVINPEIQGGDYFTGSAKQSITVLTGDYTTGASMTAQLAGVVATVGQGAAVAILNTDTVAATTSTGAGDFAGIPAGTPLLDWHMGNWPGISTVTSRGGDLAVVGSTGVTGANGHWTVMGSSSGAGGHIYTRTVARTGTGLTPGTFNAAGLFQVIAQAAYSTQATGAGPDDVISKLGSTSSDIFVGGHLTATGTSSGNNISNALITRVTGVDDSDPTTVWGSTGFPISGVWVPWSAQTTASTAGTRVLTPLVPNSWFLDGGNDFSSTGTGATLDVSGDVNDGNNGSFPVTSYTSTTIVTGSEPGQVTEKFVAGHLPTVSLELGVDSPPFTFLLQDLTAELTTNPFRFIGALLLFNSSNPAATGTYRITGYKPDLSGVIYTERVVQADDIQAQALVDPPDNVTIYLPVANTSPFQPTFFFVPATGKRAFVGMFDRLTAYNNWRQLGANQFMGHITDVLNVSGTYTVMCPTAQERVSTVNDNQQLAGSGTVGIKCWTIQTDTGLGTGHYLSGTATVSFEQDAFPEDGFALAPEAPWLVSVGPAGGITDLALKTGGTYVYTFIWEGKDSQGNRVFSPPSPPLEVSLTGTDAQIVIGGDLPMPWNTTPDQITGQYGITNRSPLTLNVERTSYVNGIPTTTRYKITNDLLPNATAPISASNPSGFNFTGTSHIQFTYLDQNTDQIIQKNEQDYSLSFLPRFGFPACSDMETWNDRLWFVLPDGSIGFSTPLTDGTRPNWFPGFIVSAPPGDRAVAVRGMQQFLIVLGERSHWYLPATALPSAALIDVGQIPIPTLIPLPFTNGCTGQALTTAAGVMYASSAGGIWTDTRSLTNDFLSQPMVNQFKAMTASGRKVTSIVIDRDQRIAFGTGTTIIVYDAVSGLWSEQTLPGNVGKLTVFNGALIARMGTFVMQQSSAVNDTTDNGVTPIDWDVDMAGISFGSVRAFQRLWRIQVIGQYRAAHNMDLTFTYPDDFPDDPTDCPRFVPVAGQPYLIEAIPGHGKASQFGVHISINHDGLDPGASCTLELLAAKVGLQPGQKQVPSGHRV